MLRVKLSVMMMVLGFSILLPGTDGEAATVEAMTMSQMAQRAEMIFIGRVVGSRAEWNTQRTRIYTYTTFQVERFLKGGAAETEITIRLWGGQVGRMRAVVPGTPRFASGEEVLLFCAGTRARVPTLLGLAQGKFTLSRNASGERILKRDISGLVLVNHRTDSRPVGAPLVRYSLHEVEAHIRAALVN